MASHEFPRADESQPSSPSLLTPKSKVRAMLATLGDDSDCGINPISVQLSLPVNEDQKTALCQYPMGEVSTNAHPSGETENESEDEDSEIVTRPRGRVAARMHAAQAKDTNSDLDIRNNLTREHEKEMVKNHDEIGSVEGRVSSNCGGNNGATSISKRSKIQRARASTPKSDTSLSPPNRSRSIAADTFDSDDDLPTNPGSNPRFLALVQKIREERLAKEAEAARQKAAKAIEREKLSKHHPYLSEEDDIEFSDDDEARGLQKHSRPTRKASKKALEEMHRETQRIGRNMQLAHEARTRKKISKASLFEKFNYKSAKFVENVGAEQALPGSSSPAVQSDVELTDTPPTSPISHNGENKKATSSRTDLRTSKLDINETLNEDNTHTSPSRLGSRLGKGKEKAVDESNHILSSNTITQKGATNLNERLIRIRLMKNLVKSTSANDDSDSDLEIVAAKTPARRTIDSIFDRIPAAQTKESHSLQALRMLAHLTSPGNQIGHGNAKVSVTASELQMSLQQRARQQAAREKEERLQVLRDKGVVVQTAEEREREMAEIEDLIAMARREGEEIMKREKDASKKERKARGEENALESSDDEEWEENGDNFVERVSELRSESGELSGEEELEDKEHGAMISEAETEEDGAKPVESLIDSEVSEAETAGEFTASDSEMAEDFNDDSDEQPIVQPRRRTRQLAASDDGDEDVATQFVLPSTDSPLVKQPQSPMAPPSVLRSATKTFIPGLTVAGPAGLGLTQIFAGTMDDSQIQSSPVPSRLQLQQLDTDKDSLAFLRDLPTPTLPAFELTIGSESQGIVRDSQTQISCVPESPLSSRISHNIYSQFSQSQVLGSDSLPNPLVTQASDFPQPTQDTGFQAITPIKGRFSQPLPSTIDTMIIQNTPASEDNDTPPVAKKRRLRRRTDTLTSPTCEEAESQRRTKVRDTDNLEVSANVFDVMRKASKREKLELHNFDKKKSGAKDMVEEQAQESEDEYAGLGGASDDGSGEEEDEYAKEIIDDEGGKDIDASKLAAFYADKERAKDERQIEKLFKDISNGMLRRKRGADYDLSDSDDDGEARRRMKRREFARMRKALLEDERIGKIAENPKKLAFLRAIEDRGEDDRIDFLDYEPESQEATDSTKSQSQIEDRIRESQPDSVISLSKRKLSGDAEPEIRPPPHLRRVKLNKRPSNLVEIRESLSGLIEEPNASILAQDSESESGAEDDSSSIHEKEEEKENRDSFAHRRTKNISVVDRINLKRASSSTSAAGNTRLAFAVPSSTPAFKVPALLRRATTNSSISSGSVASNSTSIVSSTERTAGVLSDEGRSVVKKVGRNSGVNYFARENERKMAVKAGEKRREQKMWRGAERRRKAVSDIFGAGKFD